MQIIYLSKFIPSFWFLTSLLYLFLFILITNIHLYYLFQIITHTLTMWIIQPRRASLVGYNKVSIVLYQMLSFSKKLKVFFTMLITENIETLYYSHFFRKRLVRFAKKNHKHRVIYLFIWHKERAFIGSPNSDFYWQRVGDSAGHWRTTKVGQIKV